VPVLWDSRDRRIVSNDSGRIMRAFDRAPPGPDAPAFTLAPEPMRAAIDALNAELYDTLNNAVYQAGFAAAQAAYDTAVARVFDALGGLEARLSGHRYLFGNTVTESDWRLFATLVRFDAIYAVLFKCSLRRLVDHGSLWAYARDLHAWRGVAATVDFEVMRVQSYLYDQPVEHPIVAIMPDADWRAPHGRERLGPARIALLDGARADVDPATLERL
jgi:putative glutathione S-transferase